MKTEVNTRKERKKYASLKCGLEWREDDGQLWVELHRFLEGMLAFNNLFITNYEYGCCKHGLELLQISKHLESETGLYFRGFGEIERASQMEPF
uniref:Uncharacterized protein n=1 Tax=Nelumbo nucifera TaxID=4432 RepID=A0A822ZA83_NELNU|nr:TPA_asm: hypothetical protein HUJ06_016120 [Nelumbo nucifera]